MYGRGDNSTHFDQGLCKVLCNYELCGLNKTLRAKVLLRQVQGFFIIAVQIEDSLHSWKHYEHTKQLWKQKEVQPWN